MVVAPGAGLGNVSPTTLLGDLMRLTLTPAMLDALERATDKPDWLIAEVARLRSGGDPFVLPLSAEQSTALEELCAMNIRFNADGSIKAEHLPLDELATLVMQNY
jgi:hypothetical protein